MTAQTATLTDFLLARIAEDEEFARKAQRAYQHVSGIPHYFDPTPSEFPTPMVGMSPQTALAECEAKRRIVDNVPWSMSQDAEKGAVLQYEFTLRLLAQPYADHEEFQEAWRV
jgi:hypothetical protein